MKQILIIGSGGREHALARAFAQSPAVSQVYVAPGNPGMLADNQTLTLHAPIETVDITVDDIQTLVSFALDKAIDISFVGPEVPLEMGIVDQFKRHNLAIVGPSKVAAQLENSKQFAKDVMAQAGVQTAAHQFFDSHDFVQALDYAKQLQLPFVIKADGLMSGKGVVIPKTMTEAEDVLEDFMVKKGLPLLIEEFLVGNEFSHFSLINEDQVITLGTACDYKPVGDGDQGANTGGMGSFAPVQWMTPSINQQIIDEIVQPVADQMVKNGTPFTGVLYTGLIWTAKGPKVIEFNTRLGDPETQVVLPLLETDFLDIVEAYLNKTPIDIQNKTGVQLGVVLAAAGYPKDYIKGMKLDLNSIDANRVLYAGVTQDAQNQLLANGGRILMVTGHGEDIESARTDVYGQMHALDIADTFYRNDIGYLRERSDV
ncbi:phosphoribosylamine--glycine ligase [Aerococcus agrisoli]|uniref:Phosphoribosylamine--glycine ligase n=1 Tax=Aerococcus agrisoli TaxID=2487350 RepID=A0A3N4GR60_9LACT|nr:phosphoribosylamine--glycine ligase [Aerococcus agrisoli]RPA63648.1 phosphoribosylamine--glycine ligase [Aerococcus agrisoli]